jgi:hypothetical protein
LRYDEMKPFGLNCRLRRYIVKFTDELLKADAASTCFPNVRRSRSFRAQARAFS